MVFEQFISTLPPELALEFSKSIDKVVLWAQALGIMLIIWLIFQIILLVNNIKRTKRVKLIQDQLNVLEKKIDKLIKKRK